MSRPAAGSLVDTLSYRNGPLLGGLVAAEPKVRLKLDAAISPIENPRARPSPPVVDREDSDVSSRTPLADSFPVHSYMQRMSDRRFQDRYNRRAHGAKYDHIEPTCTEMPRAGSQSFRPMAPPWDTLFGSLT